VEVAAIKNDKPERATYKFYERWLGCVIITIGGWALLGAILGILLGPRGKLPEGVRWLIVAPFVAYWIWFLLRVFCSKERRASLIAFFSSFVGKFIAISIYVLLLGLTAYFLGVLVAAILLFVVIPLVGKYVMQGKKK